MKLYEIGREYLAAMCDLEAMADEGVVTPEIVADTLEGISGEWEQKALNVAKYIATLEAEVAAIKEVEQRKAQQRRTLEGRADGLRRYLLIECQRTGLTPKDAEIQIKLGKSSAVILDDESAIPEDFKREIPARFEADKIMIGKALRDGYQIPGAHIETRQNLQIK